MIQNGSRFLIAAGILVLAIAAIGYINIPQREIIPPAPSPTPIPVPPPTTVCTDDLKICPDGSYVARTEENCKFAECPAIKPPSIIACKKDSDCPSFRYTCEATLGTGTVCSENNVDDPSCIPIYTIEEGECKLKKGERCQRDSDCGGGLLCHANVCTSPLGQQCSGPNDTNCPSSYECVQGCGWPVPHPDEPPPSYFCQLKGYYRPCPICLAANTLIDTPSGAVAVQKLKEGMTIWTANKQGERIPAIIIKAIETSVPLTHQVVHIILSDERNVFASLGHPTTDGRTIRNLVAGEIYNGARIVSVERVLYTGKATYDILPSGETGFYWANGILLGSTLR